MKKIIWYFIKQNFCIKSHKLLCISNPFIHSSCQNQEVDTSKIEHGYHNYHKNCSSHMIINESV